ncbi:ATP-dependent DNA helicase [Mycoplasmopsis glycophila]|uniref:Exodeoxyribonuclease V subunit alpha n=1 Tax=Mycoplasmopsis glycophila TaxID=171285 RepID=A0A449AU79_9BACT|nr:AAA family ATPase [Mycoplasmopsis glycophila]VEU70046.1 exodeoxyribonuclease V subunit alpha [Mycoplasmopsis glycophila]
MNNEGKKLVGLFVKILSQVQDKWALLSFKDEENNKIWTIFAGGVAPKLRTYYEIEIVPNTTKYKNNFKLVKYVPVSKPHKEVDWEDFLSKNIAGIGKKTAEKIFNAFGIKIWSLLNDVETNKEQLLSVLTETQLNSFIKFYENKNNKENIHSLLDNSHEVVSKAKFFYENNLVELYQKLLAIWEKEPHKDLVEYYTHNNPYILYFKYNFKLEEVDSFALLLNWSITSEQRVKAYIKHIMTELENDNSTIIQIDKLFHNMQQYFDLPFIELEQLIFEQIDNRFLITKDIYGKFYCTLNSTYEKELFIKDKLTELSNSKIYLLNSLDPKQLKNLSSNQQEAYEHFLLNNVSIITGGPGTGKTFLIDKIFQTLKNNKYTNLNDFAILAPTGRAASNVSSKIDGKVKTIHSFLRISSDDDFIPTDIDKEDIKVLIIDEFSMVNLNIFYKLLTVCENLEKIVLIGDVDQLPAIGPGNLLEDLIKSNKFPTTYLKEYFRSDSKTIWEHFNSIKTGKLAQFEQGVVEEYICDKFDFTNSLVDLYCERLKEKDLDDITILCPTYKGEEGLININNKIQEKINPNGQIVYKYKRKNVQVNFKINDKIIQLENRIEEEISNGDFGYIKDIVQLPDKTKIIKVLFKNNDEEKIVDYTETEFNQQIGLGYGVTVHKFQGSEIDEVIFVVHPKHDFMLSKKMLYTATSRPKEKLFIATTNENAYKNIQQKNLINKEMILTNLSSFLKGD